jgi:soluble lytic murein transglycosylase
MVRASLKFMLTAGLVLLLAPVHATPKQPERRPAAASVLTQDDEARLARAMELVDKSDWQAARQAVGEARDPLPIKLVDWYWLRVQGGGASFADIDAFMRANPHWPDRATLQRRAEEALNEAIPDHKVVAWFAERQPLTGYGRMRLAEALLRTGNRADGVALLRRSWIEDDFGEREARDVLRQHGELLREQDHVARLDRMLWEGRRSGVDAMLKLVPKNTALIAQARVALQSFAHDVDSRIAKVPSALRDDPGLVYDRVRWRRAKGLNEETWELLLKPWEKTGRRPDKWWRERRIQARNALELGYYSEAYRLAGAPGQPPSGAEYAEAEWLAGWIALRFLKEPKTAASHFKKLYEAVSYPISKARGAYWSARAAEARGDKAGALNWHELAARHPTTYYGQLSLEALGRRVDAALPADPKPTPEDIRRFEDRELARVVRMLAEADLDDWLRPFVLQLNELAATPGERALVGELAARSGRLDLAVRASKQASYDGISLLALGYPVIEAPSDGPERALLLAVSRQESEFNDKAVSPAGARGVMQLMPATAKAVAKALDIAWRGADGLHEAPYNVRLGSAYLSDLLGNYDGSYVMAIAAYNAGPGRVSRWVKDFGDPRRRDAADLIDWIELIPIPETRNYVQRVLEGANVYRVLLGDGRGPRAAKAEAD